MSAEDNILELPPPPADAKVAYGADANQFIELYRPKANKQHHAVFFLHGGFWRAKYDLKHAGHLCHDLKGSGWLAMNVEYRRVGNEHGGWPATFSDIREAFQFALSSAKKWEFDPEKLVAMGHSAGGQLAFALAGHEARVKKAVSLAGVLDLQKAYDLHLSHDAAVEFLGGTPQEMADHYKEASPTKLHIGAQQVVVHGTKDDTVPYEIAVDYVRQKQGSERIQFLSLPDAGHFELIDPRTKEWKKIVESL